MFLEESFDRNSLAVRRRRPESFLGLLRSQRDKCIGALRYAIFLLLYGYQRASRIYSQNFHRSTVIREQGSLDFKML